MFAWKQKTVLGLQLIQANAAVEALQGHKTKHLAKFQTFFSFPTLPYLDEKIIHKALYAMKPRKKDTMQIISELRKQGL